jgi:predicted component of type VI protein secretion system
MAPRLVVKAGTTDREEYPLEPGKRCVIGRSREADVIVKDQLASRRHCVLEADADGQWLLTDQNSSNGTLVNGQRVTERSLHDGDLVQVGKAVFELVLERAPGEAPREESPEPAAAAGPDPGAVSTEEAAPSPAATAKGEDVSGDLQDLFHFLDRVDAKDRPAPKEEADEQAPLVLQPIADTPPPKESDEGVLFSLVEDDDTPSEPPGLPAASPPEKKEGGLLAFLRKKKPS